MKHLLLFLSLVLAVPASAGDGTPIKESRPLAADGRIKVINISGLIEVKAWNRNEVQVTGTLGRGSEKLEIGGTPEDLRVEVKLPRRARDVEGSQLYLNVPEGASVVLEGVNADLRLVGTRGDARLASVSGSVTVDGAMRRLRVESVSGDLRIKAPSADTRLEAVSGDIAAEQLSGHLRMESVSGDIRASGGVFTQVEMETVSGDIELRMDGLAEGGEIRADSVSGDLQFHLPKNTNAEVVLETFSGDLHSDLGRPARPSSGTLEVTLGSGKARVHAESHSGDVAIRAR